MDVGTEISGVLRRMALVGCLAGAALSSASAATHSGTIILTSGEIYDNTTFDVDQQQQRVTIAVSSGQLFIPFSDIAHVFDIQGDDVTQEWLYPDAEKWRTSNEKIWHSAIRFAGDFSLLDGKLYSTEAHGWGLDVSFSQSFTRRIGLRLGLTLSRISSRFNTNSVDLRPRLSALRSYMAAQVDLRADRPTFGRTFYYVYGGFGLISHAQKGTRFTNCFGISIVNMVSEHIGLDVGVGADMVYGNRKEDAQWWHFLIKREFSFIIDFRIGAVAYL